MSKLLKKKPFAGKEDAAPEAASPSASSTSAAYMRVLKDYSLLMEYKRLKQQSPTGVYVLPAADTLRRWYGVIFVRKGHYRGAVFRFVVLIPDSYPEEGPKVHFLSEVFHPLIHPDTGLLDLSLQFPVWSSSAHYIVLLLVYVKRIFYKTDMWEARQGREAMNAKAQNLWLRNKADYLRLCEQNALKSVSPLKLYGAPGLAEDERSSIHFERPRPAHEEAWRRITRQDLERGVAGESYLDWFSDGVYKLDNRLDAAPQHLPPTSAPAPQPAAGLTVSSLQAAASQGAQLLGLMSPISPLVRMNEAADAAAAAAATQGAETVPEEGEGEEEEEEGSTLTVAQLASIQ